MKPMKEKPAYHNETGTVSRERARGDASGDSGPWDRYVWIIGQDGKARRIEPGIAPLAHGVPERVAKLRGYGNAIVPEDAMAFLDTMKQIELAEVA